MNDWELLNEYNEEGNEDSFKKLVQRHSPMVYSSAFRRAGREQADDITQAVFIMLARKAPKLSETKAKSLAGWLFRTTQLTALEALRSRKRRQKREEIAAENKLMNAEEQKESAVWRKTKPLIDSALDCLNKNDKEAVLLRFFHDASYAQIGETLGIPENTATKRVSRAQDKIRIFFKRKGIALSVPAISIFLSTKCAEAAIPAVAVSSISTAVAPTLLAEETMRSILLNSLKTFLLTSFCAASVSVAGIHTFNTVTAGKAPVSLKQISPFILKYKARITLPDDALKFQINIKGNQKTYFTKLGEEVLGFKLVKHEIKTEEKMQTSINKLIKTDVSELTLQRGNKEIILVLDKYKQCDRYNALLTSQADQTKYQVETGSLFKEQDQTYKVISIDHLQNRITIERTEDGKEFVIKLRR